MKPCELFGKPICRPDSRARGRDARGTDRSRDGCATTDHSRDGCATTDHSRDGCATTDRSRDGCATTNRSRGGCATSVRRAVAQASRLPARPAAVPGRRPEPFPSGGGFTFVEVLAALAFLGILMPVIVSALMVANRAGVVAEREATAVQLGENQLNQWVAENTWSTAGSRGDFGQDYPGYRWELTKADWETGAMTELLLDISFPVQGHENQIRLSTLASDALTPAATTQ